MKNFKGIILCFIVIHIASASFLQAQGDYTGGDLDITADDEVPSNVAAITRIDGSLTILGGITSFPDFDALEVVEGDLEIGLIGFITTNTLTALVDIFPALDSVRGSLHISSNFSLQTITGFAELDSVGGQLLISGNDALTSIPSFDALKSSGHVGIIQLDMLRSISGFSALKTIRGGGIEIDGNRALRTISGFEALTSLVVLSINHNPELTSIPSFSALTRIVEVVRDDGTFGGSLFIENNAKLTTISGFSALTSIAGSLFIEDNATLSSCCGLLRFVDGTVMPGGDTDIYNNAEGCYTAGQIITDCGTGPPNPNFSSTLRISDNSDIPSNMATITRITGDLFIGGTITTFPNFDALEIVDGRLSISGITTTRLTALTDIFPALKSVHRDLSIGSNDHLQTITGFAVLNNVGGSLRFDQFFDPSSNPGNVTLTSIPSFSALTTIGRSLTIHNHAKLTAVSGFTALKSVRGTLEIERNAVLTTISGFTVLKTSGRLDISINAKLTSIPSFDALTTIEDGLFISSNDLLTSFPTFDALTTIEDNLFISNNSVLTTISGFSVLESIGEDFRISGNDNLTAISGFDMLTSIEGRFTLQRNAQLTDLPDFSVLESVGHDFVISDNDVLATLPSFSALKRIVGVDIGGGTFFGGNLSISNNPKLTTISSFSALKSVRGTVDIERNAKLTTISGFSALTNINDAVYISENASLTTISGFGSLTSVTGDLLLVENTLLSSCCGLLRIADGTVSVGGDTTISNNAAGCNSEAEIKADCGGDTDEPIVGLPSLANDIRFYPNPAAQTLYIEGISQETALIIRTLSGKTLLRTTLHQNQAIDLAFIPQGTYLLSLQNTQEQISKRLIIKL